MSSTNGDSGVKSMDGWGIMAGQTTRAGRTCDPYRLSEDSLVITKEPLMTQYTSDASSIESISPRSPKSWSIEEIVRDGFYRCVDTSGECWLWTNPLNSWGYGTSRIAGATVLAHRLSWVIENGAIPEGMLVLHKCDVRHCVNPSHLFLGTNQDNTNDMVRKGRLARNSPLTPTNVADIRRRYKAGGVSTIKLAGEFGIGVTTVAGIIHRRTWAWVPDDFQEEAP